MTVPIESATPSPARELVNRSGRGAEVSLGRLRCAGVPRNRANRDDRRKGRLVARRFSERESRGSCRGARCLHAIQFAGTRSCRLPGRPH